eukprot:m.54567 g.54567  ORF g.54567 m.54567 type:complete len:136 (+) comp7720_c0_seq12:133-540(+)
MIEKMIANSLVKVFPSFTLDKKYQTETYVLIAIPAAIASSLLSTPFQQAAVAMITDFGLNDCKCFSLCVFVAHAVLFPTSLGRSWGVWIVSWMAHCCWNLHFSCLYEIHFHFTTISMVGQENLAHLCMVYCPIPR